MKLLAFLLGCIPLRIALAFIAYKYPRVLPYMAVPALMIAIGFAIIYTFKLRKTGLEVSGRKIWWDHLRPIHAAFFFLFAMLAFRRSKYAWVPLALDVTLGLTAFLLKYYYFV